MFNNGRLNKLMPFLLLAIVMAGMLTYYVFAGVASVTLNGPANYAWVSNGSWLSNGTLNATGSAVNVSFNCSAVLDVDQVDANLTNITLWIYYNSSESRSFGAVNQTNVTNSTGAIITLTNLPQGRHNWTCSAANITTGAANWTFASANRTVYVDWTKPYSISLYNVTNALNTTATNLNFSWIAIDNLATAFYCNLTIDTNFGNQTIIVSNGSSLNVTTVNNTADGTHYWNVSCWDPTNMSRNRNTSETRYFTVDALPPQTIDSNIANNSYWPATTVNLNWTAANEGTSVLYCNVSVDEVLNSSTQTAYNATMARYSAQSLTNGLHNWNVNCSTYLGTWNATGILLVGVSPWSFWVDTVKPHTIRLGNLTNGLNSSTSTVSFNWTAYDNVADTMLCNLTIDTNFGNVTFKVSNGSYLNNTDVTKLAEGKHYWNATCWDRTNASANYNTSETRYFSVDTTIPGLAHNIGNGTNFSSSTVSLNWTVTDAASSVAYCNLSIDGAVNDSHVFVRTNMVDGYSLTGLTEGQHTWVVSNCTDSVNNTNSTNFTVKAFNVDLTDPVPALALGSSAIALSGTQTISCTASDTRDAAPTTSFSVQLPNDVYSTDLDGTFTDTSVIGTYTVKCSATDNSGRSAITTSTFTVGAEITSGGGSSGGGAVSAPTPTVSTTISVVAPGNPAVVKVNNAKIAVSEITLEVKEEASNVKISVGAITSSPSGTPVPEGKVYKYLNINKENLADENIKTAKIKFFIDRTWLAENGVTPANVVLKRYTTAWEELSTKVITSDEDTFYFEAETPGFSTFAIGVKAVAPAEEVEEEAPVEEAPVEEAPAEEAPVVPAEAPAKSLAWLYVVIVVVVVGILAAFFFLKKKKK